MGAPIMGAQGAGRLSGPLWSSATTRSSAAAPSRPRRVRWAAAAATVAVGVAMAAELVSAPAPAPGAAGAATARRPRRLTIAAGGDVLIHRAVYERARAYGDRSGRAFDFRPMFSPIRPIVSGADLALCHLEVPLSKDNTDLSSYPSFNAPRQVARGLRHAGYDGCSTASNHSLDQGERGIRSTLDVLSSAGLRHEGTARSRRGGRRPGLYEIDGVKIGHLSFTYGLNGYSLPEGKRWLVNLIDPRRIKAQARRARDLGARFVVVSLHWGDEYQTGPTSYQWDVARRVLAARAVDVVIGHHAHVVQPITRVRKRFVAFGMGNQLSAQHSPPSTKDGAIVKLVVEQRSSGRFVVDRVRYAPTWVEPSSYRILPVARTLRARRTPESLRRELWASWRRTVDAIRLLGRRPKVAPTSYPR